MIGGRHDKGKTVASYSRRSGQHSRPIVRTVDDDSTQPPSQFHESVENLDDSVTQDPSHQQQSPVPNADTDIDDHRIYIHPRGHEFSLQTGCARKIGKIIEKAFGGPWKSFRHVPADVRDMWFAEFEKDYKWLPDDSYAIRKIFDTVGSNILKNRLFEAKRSNKKPPWMGDSIWHALREMWGEQPYLRVCEQNKKNRASDCDGQGYPMHAGGSITHLTHIDKLTAQSGVEPTVAEGFMHTHSRLNAAGERVWVDDRSRRTHEAYKDKYEIATSESSNSVPPPMSTQIERWQEVAGGSQNKGRIYGIGGLAAQKKNKRQASGSTAREKELESKLETVTAELQGVQQVLRDFQSKFDSVDQFMRMAGITQMSTPQYTPSTVATPYPSTGFAPFAFHLPTGTAPLTNFSPGSTMPFPTLSMSFPPRGGTSYGGQYASAQFVTPQPRSDDVNNVDSDSD